ncbi:MAG: glycosyltransferase family 39 protein [Saprospiraceae bacterium]
MPLSLLLLSGTLCFLWSLWLFFEKKRYGAGILVLCLAAFFLRLYMAFVDPFLHDWDERFHALVAKNMIAEPFRPMLRVSPVLPYDFTAWCCNHIWVHKQPLFLWQMALAMKVFGVNEWALRLPSVLLSTLMTYWIYRIALIWTREQATAFLAALLSTFSYYQLELTAGYLSLDHNDLVFTAYVTGGIWAFSEYTRRPGIRWAMIAGVFTGLDVLVKWLTALVIFGGAGLYLLSQRDHWSKWQFYRHWLSAFGLVLVIMAPWQLYILREFPKESAWEYAYNFKHITDRLGAFTAGDAWYYLKYLNEHFGVFLLPFLALGLILVLFSKKFERRYNLPMLGMAAVFYLFFSLVVETQMPAFTYPVAAVVLVLIAAGLEPCIRQVVESCIPRLQPFIRATLLILVALACLQPAQLQSNHKSSNPARQAKINNTRIFKNLDKTIPADVVVFNCKSFEDTELMFYQKNNAYHWFPPEQQLDSLLALGHKIAAFQSHTNQQLPEYMTNNPKVRVIQQEMK